MSYSGVGGNINTARGSYSGAGGVGGNVNAGGSYSGVGGIINNPGGSYSASGSQGGNITNAGESSYSAVGAGYSAAGSSYVADNSINYPENYVNYAAPAGYGYGASYSGNYGTTSSTMTYTTGTYAGVNVMYSTSGPVGYSGNVAIMYSTPNIPGGQTGGQTAGQTQGGQLVSPGGSLRGRLPLLLKQPGDGEEPTYVTVKAKK